MDPVPDADQHVGQQQHGALPPVGAAVTRGCVHQRGRGDERGGGEAAEVEAEELRDNKRDNKRGESSGARAGMVWGKAASGGPDTSRGTP